MGSSEPNRVIDCAVMAAALLLCPEVSHADQGGGSFWFPGQFASLASVQQTPGWALSVNYFHARVAAAKQYPVVASIDQVVVNGDHAEANVTTFMAYAPETRSTRSFDLQFRDEQWKICQAPS